MRMCRVTLRLVCFLERRPLLLPAIYVGLFFMAGVGSMLLASNLCPSRFRIWPEFSDQFVVWIADSCRAMVVVASVLGGVVVSLPIIPLIYGRWWTVRRMVVAAFITTGAVYGSFLYVYSYVSGYVRGDIRVARINVMRQKEAILQGKTSCKHIPRTQITRTYWEFYGGEYYIVKYEDGTYGLYCRQGTPPCKNGCWKNPELRGAITGWTDSGDRLLLTFASGKGAILTYQTGEVKVLRAEGAK